METPKLKKHKKNTNITKKLLHFDEVVFQTYTEGNKDFFHIYVVGCNWRGHLINLLPIKIKHDAGLKNKTAYLFSLIQRHNTTKDCVLYNVETPAYCNFAQN